MGVVNGSLITIYGDNNCIIGIGMGCNEFTYIF